MMTRVLPPSRVRPLSARSVVLSLLLGTHPPELPVRELVRSVEPFGVAEPTLRVALSRMVTAGDLLRAGTTYRLSDRLLERQRRQDAALRPQPVAWGGEWEVAVVVAVGRAPAERAQLRADLTGLRLAELRDGVWLRPANLRRPWPAGLAPLVRRFSARPEDLPADDLAGALWALGEWADVARSLLAQFTAAARPADRFTAAAAIVRHLLTDPVLPEELLPPAWPGAGLRAAYAGFQAEVTQLTRGLR